MSADELNDSNSGCINNTETTLANKLRSALEFTCRKYLSGIKFSLFRKRFKEIHKKNPQSLRNIYEQFNVQLTESITADIDQLCKEHRMEFLLNSLDSIKKEQDPSQSSWRPSGNPEEDLRDHIYPVRMRHKEALQEVLTKLQASNEELINVATVNHAEIMHIKKKNEDLHEEFSNLITSFSGSNLQNFQSSWMNLTEEQ